MRKQLLSLICIGLFFSSSAQEVAVSTDSISLSAAFDRFKLKDESLKFFYRPEWINGVMIHKRNVQTTMPLDSAINLLLTDTRLNFFLNNNHVVLLYNTQIVIPPILENDPKLDDGSGKENVQNLVFRQNTSSSNPEEQLYVIGNIKKFEKGGQSTIRGRVMTDSGPAEGVYIFNSSPFVSAISDEDGQFSLTLPNGINQIHFQSVSTIDTYRKINLYSDGPLDVMLDVF